MTRDELQRSLETHRLSYLADAVVALAAPTVNIRLRPADEASIRIGASKIGGCPDLPDGVDWPAWRGPMAFLAQFYLAEVAPFEESGLLPTRGLLSFFAAIEGIEARAGSLIRDEDEDDGALSLDPREVAKRWHVRYDEREPSALSRRPFPPDLDDESRVQPCAVRYAAAVTLPDVDGLEMSALWTSVQAERTPLVDIASAANEDFVPAATGQEGGWHLLGHPYDYESHALVLAYGEARGITDLDYELYQRAVAEPELCQAIRRDAEEQWCPLLQAASVQAADLYWDGIVHFCIEREALARRDFTRAWLVQQARP